MSLRGFFLVATLASCVTALRVPPPPIHRSGVSTPPTSLISQPNVQAATLAAALALLAVVEPAAAAQVSSEVAWVGPVKGILTPFLTLGTIAFLLRVVLSWFPKYDLKELPWVVIAAPTEPFLKPTRAIIQPVAGVDISPIVWVSFLSFLSEILCGPQGLLTIIEKKGSL